jgi:hypothetical protein
MNPAATIPTGGEVNVGVGYVYKTQNASKGDQIKIAYDVVDSPPESFGYFRIKPLFEDGSGKKVYLEVTNIDS